MLTPNSWTIPQDDRPKVAIAILHQGDRFLMQLRDDIPGIVYPGHWALFGGHLEPGETIDTAIQRELSEEIGYNPPQLNPFGCYSDTQVIRYVYQGVLPVTLEELVLKEGWDMDWLTVDDIVQGKHYSERANQVRPLGKPHQQILLEFIAKQNKSYPSLNP